MAKGNIEQRVEALRALSREPATEATVAALRAALADRSAIVAGQAAKTVADLRIEGLAPQLVQAFERLMDKGASTDPKCLGKKAIVDALKRMDYDDSRVFVKGLRHVQMEAVWGGKDDTATALRGSSALALIQCRDISRRTKLQHLVDVLADPYEPVRLDAIRAIGQMEGDDSALVLRLKGRLGDQRSRVTGQVLESLLAIEGDAGVSFVGEFLQSEADDVCEEAALTLAASRTNAGFQAIKDAWDRERGRPRSGLLLRAVSASGLPEALDFLIDLIREGEPHDVDRSVAALELHSNEELRARVKEALRLRESR